MMDSGTKCFLINRIIAQSLFLQGNVQRRVISLNELIKHITYGEVDHFDKRIFAKIDLRLALISKDGKEIMKVWHSNNEAASVHISIKHFHADIVSPSEYKSPDEISLTKFKTNLFLFTANVASALVSHYGDVERHFDITMVNKYLTDERSVVTLIRKNAISISLDTASELTVILLYPVEKVDIYPEYYFNKVCWSVFEDVNTEIKSSEKNFDEVTNMLFTGRD